MWEKLAVAQHLLKMAYQGIADGINYPLMREAGVQLAGIAEDLRRDGSIHRHPWYDPPAGSRVFNA